MKKKLRRRFIIIAMTAFTTVMVFLLVSINGWTVYFYHQTLEDSLMLLQENKGEMPSPFTNEPVSDNRFRLFFPTMRIANRYVSVIYDGDEVERYITDSFNIISEEDGIIISENIMSIGDNDGWYLQYRYKVMEEDGLIYVMFVDGSFVQYTTQSLILASLIVFGVTTTLVLVVIILVSSRAIRPLVAAYDKQNQFMTDAGHELKTPLTIINANASILEMENKDNEWIDGIKKQVNQMNTLIHRIIHQSSLDEKKQILMKSDLDLNEMMIDLIESYKAEIKHKKIVLTMNITDQVIYNGNHEMISELLQILLDNAVLYTPNEGFININIKEENKLYLSIENNYPELEQLQLDKLFDRFYRADSSRNERNSHGLGLSIARAIVERHKGKISVEKIDHQMIRFIVELT